MKEKFKHTIFLSFVLLCMLTLSSLSGCGPSVEQTTPWPKSPLAIAPLPSTYPRPTPKPITPWPTPTFLPSQGVRLGEAQALTTKPDSSLASVAHPRFFAPATDGKTLVGVVRTSTTAWGIVAIDLASGKMRLLFESQEGLREPQVSGKYVVWTGSSQSYFYDLERDQLGYLNFGAVIRHARLSGNMVVVERIEDLRSSGQDIWGYDLEQQKDFAVAAGPGGEFGPLISGRWVIYQSTADKSTIGPELYSFGLYAVNLDNGEDIRLGSVYASSSQYVPPLYAIDAPWVAWSASERSSGPQLYFYNLDTGFTHTVTVTPCISPNLSTRPEHLALSGDVLIFRCSQGLGYDIKRGVFFSLPLYTPEEQPSGWNGWAIFDDQLVWSLSFGSGEKEESRIYQAWIERNP